MPDLPSGTVTFLFTDIEGSIMRWEHHRAQMQAVLARHGHGYRDDARRLVCVAVAR